MTTNNAVANAQLNGLSIKQACLCFVASTTAMTLVMLIVGNIG